MWDLSMIQGKDGMGGSKLSEPEKKGRGEFNNSNVANSATHARDCGLMNQAAQVGGKYESLAWAM